MPRARYVLQGPGELGDYSLNDNALRDRRFETITVRVAQPGDWMRRNIVVPEHKPIWKSDKVSTSSSSRVPP